MTLAWLGPCATHGPYQPRQESRAQRPRVWKAQAHPALPSSHTYPLTLQPDALGNHLEADDAVRVLPVLFQVFPVVVEDEREVIVQVDLSRATEGTKELGAREPPANPHRETGQVFGPFPHLTDPAVPTFQIHCSHSSLLLANPPGLSGAY